MSENVVEAGKLDGTTPTSDKRCYSHFNNEPSEDSPAPSQPPPPHLDNELHRVPNHYIMKFSDKFNLKKFNVSYAESFLVSKLEENLNSDVFSEILQEIQDAVDADAGSAGSWGNISLH
ncbi:unnamed protein product [Orchesella dallaii]|uniref:Uncharacterized protein n=1 Tax=Orchesella dallaii TaxID=48710 RepID=A0ABP1RWA4_9HEXA